MIKNPRRAAGRARIGVALALAERIAAAPADRDRILKRSLTAPRTWQGLSQLDQAHFTPTC